MIAATRAGSMSYLKMCSSASRLSCTLTPWYAIGNGAWYTSAGNGPKPALYGATFPVSAMAMNVRPWKPPPNAITPARPVWARAILMQFSTASAPVVTKIAFFGVGPGASLFSFSASSTATP